jgi:hypothetical protein
MNVEHLYEKTILSDEWKDIEKLFERHSEVYLACHGGNLSICRHIATDLTRLTGGKKLICAPDTDTVSIWHGDFDYQKWLIEWLRPRLSNSNKMPLVIGVSSSGASPDVDAALIFAASTGCDTCYITSQSVNNEWGSIEVSTGATHYYSSEVLTIMLFHRLMNASGFESPMIKTVPNEQPASPRLHSNDDETYQIGIDFDGVIHKCSKGYYDGTIYDEPVPGSREALQALSEKYNVIMYTCKAKPDRGLVDGKTGIELVWEWLKKYDMDKLVTKVTAEKPRAVAYIDDKGFRFTNWNSCMEQLRIAGIV